METLPSATWHNRFVQQSRWTQSLRRYLYERVDLASAHRILEVGCGTGALLMELTMLSHGEICGLDISRNHLSYAAGNLPGIPLVLGDGYKLPFPTGWFDITLCHFLLLWISDPVQIAKEMARVSKPGGAILVLAEPDYGGRIDFPPDLEVLGKWQQISLHHQGADPLMGRKLRTVLSKAGLTGIEAGVLGGQWAGSPNIEDWEMEWQILENDLISSGFQTNAEELLKLKEADRSAWMRGERILFVPTFYAWGKKPESETN